MTYSYLKYLILLPLELQAIANDSMTTDITLFWLSKTLLAQEFHPLDAFPLQDIPVIAAGGIWDRYDIDRVIGLGASGVQIGTRFITTDECDADLRYKKFHLNARPEDVTIVPSPVGMPGRALHNQFVEKVLQNSPDLDKKCLANCLQVCRCRDTKETYCIVRALDRAARGNVEEGLIFAGTNAGRAEKIVPVRELMAELIANSN